MPTPVALAPVSTVTPEAGEDPLEAEKIEAALLEQGYFSDAIPLPYDLQDTIEDGLRGIRVPLSPGAGRGGGGKQLRRGGRGRRG
ncbi:MAG: hypothetical protein ACLSHG_08420 [Oscillospiraceae bacterium]